MEALTILDRTAFELTVQRLAHQVIEDRGDLSRTVIIGLQPRGVHFSRRLYKVLRAMPGGAAAAYGELDITFHRDDFRQRAVTASSGTTDIGVSLDDKRVVLVDDVLYTGRSIRAGLDAMLSFGRPHSVELMVLIDRRFRRELPVQADYVGQHVDSFDRQHVVVEWQETDGRDRVLLHTGTRSGNTTENTQQP